VQNRASSLRRIITDIIEECDTKTAKCEEKITSKSNVRFVPTSSSENSPCASPSLITSATPYISCISPLPDVRRESFDEVFMNTLAIPVPRQFADESRRNSRVQGGISEEEEDNYVESCKAAENLLEVPTSDNSLHFKFDLPTINRYTENKSINEDDEEDENVNDLSAFRPIEVMERNHLRNLAQKKTNYEQIEPPTINNSSMNMMLHSKTETSNTLQVPIISLPYMMEKPPPKFDMTGYSILTESPQHDKSSSEEIVGESSDVVSAISNEECSVSSEILDQKVSETFPINAGDIIQDLNDDEKIGHIDSPESEMTDALHGGESLIDDMSSVLGLALHDITSNDDTTTLCTAGTSKIRKASFKAKKREQFGFENKAFDLSDITSQLPTATEPIRYCSLAQFVEGNDIARKSFKKYQKYASKTSSSSTMTTKTTTKSNEHKNQEDEEYFPSKEDDEKTEKQIEYEKNHPMNTIKIQIQGSVTDLSMETEFEISNNVNNVGRIDYRTADLTDNSITHDSIIADTPSPKISEHLRQLRASEYRRHSSHTPQTTTLAPKEVDVNRRHSNHNPNLLSYDSERVKFLNCSPAASRRISCGTLFKNADRISFNSTKNLFLTRKSISKERKNSTKDDCEKKKEEKTLKPKTLPIINPLVRLPSWPNIANSQTGAGFISKCLLANADTLCSMACPLMNPDEPLDEGFYERCVMNNYFGIGIDAKITLDFHIKREEHPEKCRSRAKNYMWYGVLGSKQWLQKTYKNLEQRVQLECDGQRIPLPSLQGIVILNIPSFMVSY
jgi:diacylglycerol kinase (ATP)